LIEGDIIQVYWMYSPSGELSVILPSLSAGSKC